MAAEVAAVAQERAADGVAMVVEVRIPQAVRQALPARLALSGGPVPQEGTAVQAPLTTLMAAEAEAEAEAAMARMRLPILL
jgi:hypothetical protein